jgi:hypothetical protein
VKIKENFTPVDILNKLDSAKNIKTYVPDAYSGLSTMLNMKGKAKIKFPNNNKPRIKRLNTLFL